MSAGPASRIPSASVCGVAQDARLDVLSGTAVDRHQAHRHARLAVEAGPVRRQGPQLHVVPPRAQRLGQAEGVHHASAGLGGVRDEPDPHPARAAASRAAAALVPARRTPAARSVASWRARDWGSASVPEDVADDGQLRAGGEGRADDRRDHPRRVGVAGVPQHHVDQQDPHLGVRGLDLEALGARGRVDHRVGPPAGELLLAQVQAGVAARRALEAGGAAGRGVGLHRPQPLGQDRGRLAAERPAREEAAHRAAARRGRPAGRPGARTPRPPGAPPRRRPPPASRRGGRPSTGSTPPPTMHATAGVPQAGERPQHPLGDRGRGGLGHAQDHVRCRRRRRGARSRRGR